MYLLHVVQKRRVKIGGSETTNGTKINTEAVHEYK